MTTSTRFSQYRVLKTRERRENVIAVVILIGVLASSGGNELSNVRNFLLSGEGLTSFIMNNRTNFSVKKYIKMELSGCLVLRTRAKTLS